MAQKTVGALVTPRELKAFDGQLLHLPARRGLTHLQFRRFAGCPMCNLHIHSFVRAHDALVAAGIQEVAVFHLSAQSLRDNDSQAPFAIVADPGKALYREWGVEASVWSVLHPRAWWAGLRGVWANGLRRPEAGESTLGLPADFLLGPDGTILALKYGRHAYDQWSVQELLDIAAAHLP
jgi:peroxiredoxin